MNRWDDYFCRLAKEVASMSTCLRRKVGCVLVRDKQIISTGYNGVPSRVQHCTKCTRDGLPSGEKLELCRGAHAEQNAVAQAAKHGISVNGCTAYVTLQPCGSCTKSMINAGIVKIVYMEGYPEEMCFDLCNQAGVEICLAEVEK